MRENTKLKTKFPSSEVQSCGKLSLRRQLSFRNVSFVPPMVSNETPLLQFTQYFQHVTKRDLMHKILLTISYQPNKTKQKQTNKITTISNAAGDCYPFVPFHLLDPRLHMHKPQLVRLLWVYSTLKVHQLTLCAIWSPPPPPPLPFICTSHS